MKNILSPTIADLSSESVLFQAWKKTESYIRSHNWYADTMELDWQALRLPAFIKEIQDQVKLGVWKLKPLRMVPAPKTQAWETTTKGEWRPKENKKAKLRPLAHVHLADQVICTAVMLCLADRVENLQSDPNGGDTTIEQRKLLSSYGHRLFCRKEESGNLRHAWAAKKLYRLYSTDYRRFLARPDKVATEREITCRKLEQIAIISADLSRFYDRVRPDLMRMNIRSLKRSDDDESFFAFVDQLFDWTWATEDKKQVSQYSQEAEIKGFDRIALPQGLVAAGFFANVILLQFDHEVSRQLGKCILRAPKIILLDACRYVDDLRLVVSVSSSTEGVLRKALSTWLNTLLGHCAQGLHVEAEKTQVVIRGGIEHTVIPQSRTAERIQQTISGGFDFEQGMHVMDALDGFLNAQHRYSPTSEQQQDGVSTVLRGVSDMRDDTAARFAAARYRKTFRSLRPLLDAELSIESADVETDEESEESITGFTDAVISRVQFDERGLLFARELLAAWEGNPAHVRLMRIAVDLFPREEFCAHILNRLRPAWSKIVMDAGRREVMLYCLAELFRAGATETGIVRDIDELPDSATDTDVFKYHAVLLEEARSIIESALTPGKRKLGRFPWYLLQQVMLYLATRQESLEHRNLSKLVGSKTSLKRSIDVYNFYTNKLNYNGEDTARHLVLQAQSFGRKNEMIARSIIHPTAELLRGLVSISPWFTDAVWRQMSPKKRKSLSQVGQDIGLSTQASDGMHFSSSVADYAGLIHGIWHEEYNFVVITRDLLQERHKNREGVLTPWRIGCELKLIEHAPVKLRIEPGTLKIRDHHGGHDLFAVPDWCETEEERLHVEVGQVLRYLLTGSIDYFRPVPRPHADKNLPLYNRSHSSWELGRYGSFNGRAAFGPDWIPLSSWAESLLINLLRWPGCGVGRQMEFTTTELLQKLTLRVHELEKLRGSATGMLFLEQEAKWARKELQKQDRPLRVAIVQSVVPNVKDFEEAGNSDLQLNGHNIRRKHRDHLRSIIGGLHKMLEVRVTHLRGNPIHRKPHLDWVIFPELAVHPDDVGPLLMPIVRRYKCLILAGLVYHPIATSESGEQLINSAIWLIPEWSPGHGFSVRRIEQGKANLAPGSESDLPGVIGHRPAQWIIRYQWAITGTRPLLLSAAVCYDATDTGLVHDLRNRNDILAVCALNRDVPTYDKLSDTLNYLLFQGVIVANNGSHGGSNFYSPFGENYQRQIIHFHGQEQASVAFAEVHPTKFISRPEDGHQQEAPAGTWKKSPAGWKEMPQTLW
jgi:hypothetical protein